MSKKYILKQMNAMDDIIGKWVLETKHDLTEKEADTIDTILVNVTFDSKTAGWEDIYYEKFKDEDAVRGILTHAFKEILTDNFVRLERVDV